MSTRQLFAVILFIALYTFSVRVPRDPDMWWHLETGKYIIENGIPEGDPSFAFTTAGREWITHEWLTDVIMFAIYDGAGLIGLSFSFALLVAIAFGLLYFASVGRPYIAGLTTTWGIASSLAIINSRPQMLNILWGALIIFIVERVRRKELEAKWLWAMPPIMLIWVNMHGGFILGFIIIGVYVVGDGAQGLWENKWENRLSWPQVQQLTIAAVVSLFVVLINPHTYKMLTYAITTTLTSEAMQQSINEWQSPNFHIGYFWVFGSMLFATWLLIAYSPQKLTWTEALFLLGTGYASLQAIRNIPLFVIVAIPIMSRHLLAVFAGTPYYDMLSGNGPTPYVSPTMKRLNWLVLALILVGAGAFMAEELSGVDEQLNTFFPVAALDYLEEQELTEARIFNEYAWGGYMIWRNIPPFIDGRADLYGDDFLNLYMGAYRHGNDWEEILIDYDIDLVLLRQGSTTLEDILFASPNWVLTYEDDNSYIFAPVE